MFGTIICNKKELTKEEQERYQGTYCGLCRTLRDRYGQIQRWTLNYDMTFLALLLNGLYEESDENAWIRCPVHPLKKQIVYGNKYIEYAADMTILLSYYKCRDDWEDESKYSGKVFSKLLQKDLQRIEQQYPRQATCVRESLERLSILEKSGVAAPDDVVNCSGRMLSEIFVYQEDFWSDTLRRFGYHLGRFIYLMDAVLDYETDQKKQNYNPLFSMECKPKDMEPMLMQTIGDATAEFEKLPIVQDVGIMRNILYGGVWQNYYARIVGKGEHHDK